MLTEEQANQLRLEQYALEDAEIRYDKVQQQLEKYNTLLNTIKDNYNSYTPEQKARISAKMWDISAKYRELKDQSYKYSIAQYEAQQQIDYYNQLATQQAPTNWGQRRRQVYVPETVIEPTPEVVTSDIPTQGDTIQVNSEYIPWDWINNYPGHSNAIMTAANSRFPTPQTIAEREGTWGSRWNTYPSWPSRTFGHNTPDYTPNEIQRVRWLRWNDYLQWMKDLEKYRGYNVVNQNAYKNWNKWTLN